ncbi:glycosyltransferase family 39 protein [Bradyrhizobium sp. JYMT SZCCT0180]|uniref:ArnT family glycosyltransferase n=1 Tax=Bradyrhizobium sp. JYMT SZCCT0180 TaxID=2807666 RepID=UPI001BA590CD|nr:glycosyltransferase family 39 protein [Bradyrhizobium sp. JYMT SZCCT0180]MBR1210750.1 glycosyltransferase family 39 protein [Bradyrhizobium sp. JYMT SZCCT0180]
MERKADQADGSTAVTEYVWTWFLRQVARVRGADIPGWVWVVLLWALMAFPAVSLRGTHFEEGTVIGLARGAVEDGQWLSPHLYGFRYVERPVLLSWIAAAIGKLSGGVSVWSARIPHLLFLLAGGLMVFHLVLPHTRKAPAVFGALCWFACPMVSQKFVTAEPDVTLSVLLFGGFFLWWKGVSSGYTSILRWLAIGLLLAAAGLAKGPQPIAYFALGVGAYLLVKRRWNDLPGFVLANAMAGLIVAAWYWMVMIPGDVKGWILHSRLSEGMTLMQWVRDHLDFVLSLFLVEWLPGSVLLFPAIAALARNAFGRERDLMLAAVLYATVASMLLLIWPGGVATRYAMPANLALAVMGGILFDRWWSTRPWLIAVSNTVVTGISTALIVLGWIVIPAAPIAFSQSKTSAQTIAAVREARQGTLYVTTSADLNTLAYVAAPIRMVGLTDIANLKPPAFAILRGSEVAEIVAQKPDFAAIAHATLNKGLLTRIFEIRGKPEP